MQFSRVATFFAIVAGIAMARPMPLHARSCDLAACAASLGPTAATCGFAVAQKGKDASRDVSCLAGIVNNVENVPASCSACAGTLGTFVRDAVNGAEHAGAAVVHGVEDAADDVGNAIGSGVSDVGNFVGSIF